MIQLLARLPGLGPRSARRAALFLIKNREKLLAPLADALAEAHRKVEVCRECGNVDTVTPCTLCSDPRRDRTLLCVVEEVGDLWALERSGAMNGLYHVLGGRLSAIDGNSPRGSGDRPSGRTGLGRGGEGGGPRRQCHGRGAGNRPFHHRPSQGARHFSIAACPWRPGRGRARLSRRGNLDRRHAGAPPVLRQPLIGFIGR